MLDRTKKSARNIAQRFTNCALNHSQSYKQLSQNSSKSTISCKPDPIKQQVLFEYNKQMQKNLSQSNIHNISQNTSQYQQQSQTSKSSFNQQVSQTIKSPKQAQIVNVSISDHSQAKESEISNQQQRCLQNEIEKKKLLQYLIMIGKQVDGLTKYLKQFENLMGQDLEVELFNFLRICIQKCILNKDFMHFELHNMQIQSEKDNQIIQEQRQILEKLKNSNIMLLKDLKDVKGVLQECQSSLVQSNQNSEIIDKIQQIQSTSNVEIDFESFLRNDDQRQSSSSSNITEYKNTYVNKVISTQQIRAKNDCFSFSQDSQLIQPKQIETPGNMTQIINLRPMPNQNQASVLKNHDTQLFDYSFSHNSSLIDKQHQRQETINYISQSPALMLNQVNSQKYEQHNNQKQCQIMIIDDEENQTTDPNNNTDSINMMEDFEEKHHPMLNLQRKIDFLDCFTINEIRSSTPIRGMIKLNSPACSLSQSTTNLDQRQSLQTKDSLAEPLIFFQKSLDQRSPQQDSLFSNEKSNKLEQQFSCKITSKTPRHFGQKSCQYTLSQLLNMGNKKELQRFLPKVEKRQSLQPQSRQIKSMDQTKSTHFKQSNQFSQGQISLETSSGDEAKEEEKKKEQQLNLEIPQIISEFDNKSPTNEQVQIKLAQMLNCEINTPQFGSPRQADNQKLQGRSRIKLY